MVCCNFAVARTQLYDKFFREMVRGNNILGKKWCKMLFEGRNTDYGAYRLRQQTGRRYAIALAWLFAILIALVAPIVITMIIFAAKPPVYDIGDNITRLEGVRIKEARPTRRPKKKSEPELSEKAEPKIEDADPIAEMLTVMQEEPVDPEKIEDISKDSIDVLRKEAKLELAIDEERTDGVIVDSIPRYPGGISTFMKWLDSTMVYPPAAVRQRVRGTVMVAFIVESDGSTADIRVVKGANKMLNNEALRALHLMQNWLPARKNGRPVRSQVTLPVVFDF